MNDKFVEHLEKLASHYGESYAHLPTVQQILSGIKFPKPDELSVTQAYSLATICLDIMGDHWKKFGSKPNVLFDQYLENYMRMLLTFPPEMLAVFGAQGRNMGFAYKVTPRETFNEFVKRFNEVGGGNYIEVSK